MPGFFWSKYSEEKHMINKFLTQLYSYFGQGTVLPIRLDENNNHKVGEEFLSPTDELTLHHDIAYRDAEKQDPEIALQIKHEADKKIIEQLD